METKSWLKSKRVHAALWTFWGTVALTVSGAIMRCGDCSFWEALEGVNASEVWAICGGFVVCTMNIFFGDAPVVGPGQGGK